MPEKEPNSDKLSGFSCPWDLVQILTWTLYFISSGWIFFVVGSDKQGLADSNIPLFVKILLTITTTTLTTVCSITDPTDELFYLDWNGQDKLTGSKDWKPELVGYCEYCQRNVLKHSKHCKKCNRCIKHFDHHCRFINVCIGDANYTWFTVLVNTVVVDVTFMIVVLAVNIVAYTQ